MTFTEAKERIRKAKMVGCATGSGPFVNITKAEALRWVDAAELDRELGIEDRPAKVDASFPDSFWVGCRASGEVLESDPTTTAGPSIR